MSTSPQMMQYLLMQKLMQGQPSGGQGMPASVPGSGMAPTSMAYGQSPLGGAAQMAQKLMLMRALQQRGQPPMQVPPESTGPTPLPSAVPASGMTSPAGMSGPPF